MIDKRILQCLGFEWDDGNYHKNQIKHGVSQAECEQLFLNEPLLFFEDIKHSIIEERMYALGKTDWDRRLFVSFTIRGHFVRVISARDMSKKEKEDYAKA